MDVKEAIFHNLMETKYFKENPITIEEFNENFIEYFDPYEYNTILDTDSHRWWDEILCVKRIGSKYYQYWWANATGDTGVEDLGWEFDENTLKEVEPYEETVTVTKYREVERNPIIEE